MYTLKLRAGKYLYPVKVEPRNDRLFLNFPYNEELKDSIKSMAGARWHPDDKQWSIANNQRNLFQLRFLAGENPYATYDNPLKDFVPRRACTMKHQREMASATITYHYLVLACVSGDTIVMTSNGPKKISAIDSKKDKAAIDSEYHTITVVAKTGYRQTYRIVAKEGYEISATEDHKFLVQAGEFLFWKQLDELRPGNKLIFNKHINLSWNGVGTFEDGYVLGHWYGDGTQSKGTPRLCIWEKDYELLPYINTILPDMSVGTPGQAGKVEIHSKIFNNIFRSYGESFPEGCCSAFYEGYLAGFFDTDGSVDPKLNAIRFTNTDEAFIKRIQLLLLHLGMRSTLSVQHERITNIRGVNYLCKPCYNLRMHSVDSKIFSERIGFRLGYKRLVPWNCKNPKRDVVTIKEIVKDDNREVYDVTVPSKSCFSANGFMAHNCEMGTGKTLTLIEVIEQSGFRDWWWVGPRNALFSVKNEFKKWTICDFCNKSQKECKCPVFSAQQCFVPRFLSYEELRKEITGWGDKTPPRGLVIDESQRCKNGKAQRSQACQYLADDIRRVWKEDGYVVEMSGSPAPKEPTDWFSQSEIACPGFLREGTVEKFRARLSLVEQRENLVTGGNYPHHVTWFDNPEKCKHCGNFKDHPKHDIRIGGHLWEASKNEVSYLYERLKGLVLVKLKKDCLDLPDKTYEVVELEPTGEMKRCASLIEAKAPTAIQALTLLRELSDGFQYTEQEIEGSFKPCPLCKGAKTQTEWDYCGPEEEYEHWIEEQNLGKQIPEGLFEKQEKPCRTCDGVGTVLKIARSTKEMPTPKEEALKAQLDLHEDVGRIVIFGGFEGSIDRITRICEKEQWNIIRVDGRGWHSNLNGGPEKLLELFQEGPDKIAFVGQPGAAGLGLNLTASPTIVYFSNDFSAESRIQSEDRIHRPGMDVNRGAKIVDFVCLKSDLLVLNNLRRKRRLQDITLGQMREEIEAIRYSDIRGY